LRLQRPVAGVVSGTTCTPRENRGNRDPWAVLRGGRGAGDRALRLARTRCALALCTPWRRRFSWISLDAGAARRSLATGGTSRFWGNATRAGSSAAADSATTPPRGRPVPGWQSSVMCADCGSRCSRISWARRSRSVDRLPQPYATGRSGCQLRIGPELVGSICLNQRSRSSAAPRRSRDFGFGVGARHRQDERIPSFFEGCRASKPDLRDSGKRSIELVPFSEPRSARAFIVSEVEKLASTYISPKIPA